LEAELIEGITATMAEDYEKKINERTGELSAI